MSHAGETPPEFAVELLASRTDTSKSEVNECIEFCLEIAAKGFGFLFACSGAKASEYFRLPRLGGPR